MAVDTLELNTDKSTEEEIKRRLLTAMLDSLYTQEFIDINVYKKVKAEIKKS
jgi:hypothetical protein